MQSREWNTRISDFSEEESRLCAGITQLRAEMGISQAKFAREIGVGRRTLIEWEMYRHSPGAEARQRLIRLKQLVDAGEWRLA
jgi:DNA-binding transcriptional regulator YiaG